MEIKNKQEMNNHFLSVFPYEGCGFVVDNYFIPCENTAEDPENDFKINKYHYIAQEKKAPVQAVVHSHTKEILENIPYDLRTPSMQDMISQKSMNIPWGICGTEGENVSDLIWIGTEERQPVLERVYIPNYHDCLTLMCDYLKINYNIDVPVFPRPADWWEMDKEFISGNVQNAGFFFLNTTNIDDLQKGDVILFQIRANYVNHVGVYVGDGVFYHHIINRLSNKDTIGKWHRQVYKFIRHEELK